MRLLLDTHIWVDCALRPDKLGPRLRREIASPRSEVWVSPVSAWELLKLIEKGRIRIKGNPSRWIEALMTTLLVTEAPVTFEIAKETSSFMLPHRDPSDTWLVATARVHNLVLATRDQNIIASGLVHTISDND